MIGHCLGCDINGKGPKAPAPNATALVQKIRGVLKGSLTTIKLCLGLSSAFFLGGSGIVGLPLDSHDIGFDVTNRVQNLRPIGRKMVFVAMIASWEGATCQNIANINCICWRILTMLCMCYLFLCCFHILMFFQSEK